MVIIYPPFSVRIDKSFRGIDKAECQEILFFNIKEEADTFIIDFNADENLHQNNMSSEVINNHFLQAMPHNYDSTVL